jgi:hypothetical protein
MNIARLIAMQITPDRLRMRGQKLLRIVQESTVGLARNLIYGWPHRADVSRYHIIAGYRHRSQAIYFETPITQTNGRKRSINTPPNSCDRSACRSSTTSAAGQVIS